MSNATQPEPHHDPEQKPPSSSNRSAKDQARPSARTSSTRAGDTPQRRPASSGANPFARRRALVEELPADHAIRQIALDLCTLDERTDPARLEATGEPTLARSITELTQYLIRRTLHRAACAIHQIPFEPPASERADAAWLEHVRSVELRFREAMVAAFPPHPGARLGVRRFQKAMTAFAGGEAGLAHLRPDDCPPDLALHGTPDGPNFLCFAEAVLLFLRLGLTPQFWEATLPTFVGATPFFLARYWDRTRRAWTSYQPPVGAPPVPGAAILASIDHTYAAMSRSQLADHFGAMLAVSLRDEPQLPRAERTAKEFQ